MWDECAVEILDSHFPVLIPVLSRTKKKNEGWDTFLFFFPRRFSGKSHSKTETPSRNTRIQARAAAKPIESHVLTASRVPVSAFELLQSVSLPLKVAAAAAAAAAAASA